MNKLDDLIAQAGICASDHVLDIGFGWGSGAIRAVQTTGCRYNVQPVLGPCSLPDHLDHLFAIPVERLASPCLHQMLVCKACQSRLSPW